MHARTHTHTCTHGCACTHARMLALTHAPHTCTHSHTTHARTHAHTHTHTHTHKYIYRVNLLSTQPKFSQTENHPEKHEAYRTGAIQKHYKHSKKAVPLQACSDPEGSRKLRFPDFMTMAQVGGKVVSLTHQLPLPSGNTPGTHFC
jgi:hypothetical protein